MGGIADLQAAGAREQIQWGVNVRFQVVEYCMYMLLAGLSTDSESPARLAPVMVGATCPVVAI